MFSRGLSAERIGEADQATKFQGECFSGRLRKCETGISLNVSGQKSKRGERPDVEAQMMGLIEGLGGKKRRGK